MGRLQQRFLELDPAKGGLTIEEINLSTGANFYTSLVEEKPYDLQISVEEADVGYFAWTSFIRDVTFKANLPGSRAYALFRTTQPTAQFVLIRVNVLTGVHTDIGLLSFIPTSNNGFFTFENEIKFSAGDLLVFDNRVDLDPDLLKLSISLSGTSQFFTEFPTPQA